MENLKVQPITKANVTGAILVVIDTVIYLAISVGNFLFLGFSLSPNNIFISLLLSGLLPLLLAFGIYKKNNLAVVALFLYGAWHFYSLFPLLKYFYDPVFNEKIYFIVVFAAMAIKNLLLVGIWSCLYSIRLERNKTIDSETNFQV